MSWQTEMTSILRGLTGDLDSPYTYSDSRLQQLIVISAQLTQQTIDFQQTYTIDIANTGISPDPTTGTRDDAFINLVSLRTYCLIATGESRAAGSNGISLRSGPDAIDTRDVATNKANEAKNICKLFEDAKFEYQAGNMQPGEVILSPYRALINNLDNRFQDPYFS